MIPLPISEPVMLIAALTYNTAAPVVVMVFDAASLPANGSVPKMQLPIAEAAGGNAPAFASFALPMGGVMFYKGIVIAASTTCKTLTVDTTTGGKKFFEVAY